VNTKLNYIHDWLPLAKQAGWSVQGMADHCGVSVRALERHFINKMGQTPIIWLNEHRQGQALELLRHGSSHQGNIVGAGIQARHAFNAGFQKTLGLLPDTIQSELQKLKPLIFAHHRQSHEPLVEKCRVFLEGVADFSP
jgi:methylphosphotriester-DNA--protein-cysteine methyltransferase